MKNLAILFLYIAALISFTQCSNSPNELCTNAASRGKVISSLMNNEAYMTEVMDSMRTKHPEVILSTVFVLAKSNEQIHEKMMDGMADMCKSNPSTFNTMMGKAMDMCDADSSKRNMMMGAMHSRPNVMKSMEGMCDMKGMNMDDKKESNPQHHK